jgi:2-C-methyl-D-erythritol 4-phosphate cytidylyltransferase / 2-C-methyl-D-erythritol 2,4-cyclodiphosphate synthase
VVRSVRAALSSTSVAAAIVAVPDGFEDEARSHLGEDGVLVLAGGDSRHASVAAALDAVPGGTDVVVVHDAARPFATPALFDAVVAATADADGVVPGLRLTDTVKRVHDGWVVSTEPREALWTVQTPQAFGVRALLDAHERARVDGRVFTDDAAALEWAGYRVRLIEGEIDNFKITTAADLERAVRAAERARG